MPRASHRVDLLFLPDSLDRTPDPDAFAALKQRWKAEGRLGPGASRDALVEGGFRRLWLDLPGRLTLYANQQGGYYVRCPVSGGNLAAQFSEAVQEWRSGGPFSLLCPRCGAEHALSEITLSPPGAFAHGAVIFSDVGSLNLADGVAEALAAVIGPSREIIRRVG